MAKTYRFAFRLNRQEAERLRNNARLRGFASVAGFVRVCVLERDFWLEKKLTEIQLTVKDIEKKIKD